MFFVHSSISSVSAAGQAITTYIRNHLHRCEVQQDHPLLLRHVLSGTPSDDELAPALHSRVGGAHCTVNSSESRVTNFRRGTMVWYLSKAAGAPCPFSRAGVRLCDYTENGKIGVSVSPGKERKRERDRLRRAEQCGQKRKRLLRACADRELSSESSDEEERPPKVKLTLRLKPSGPSSQSASPFSSSPSPHDEASPSPEVIDLSTDLRSDDCSMSPESSDSEEDQCVSEKAWSLPPYPRRSISIPHYMPSADSSYPTFSHQGDSGERQRSPSLSNSGASDSPPPDSEDEDDFHISMTGCSHASSQWHCLSQLSDDDEDIADLFPDCDPETETQWGESPGPESPSAQFEEDITVKHEPRDVQDLLEAWEDFDVAVADMKVLDVVTQAAAGLDGYPDQPEFDNLGMWGWHGDLIQCGNHESISDHYEPSVIVKQEDMDPIVIPHVSPTSAPTSFSDPPPSPLSPCSVVGGPRDGGQDSKADACRSSELAWQDAELLGPDSVKPHDLEDGVWCDEKAEDRSDHRCIDINRDTDSSPQPQVLTLTSERREPDPSHSDAQGASQHSVLQSCVAELPTPIPPHDSQSCPSSPRVSTVTDDLECPVVVHTCQPCVPAICATELEGEIFISSRRM